LYWQYSGGNVTENLCTRRHGYSPRSICPCRRRPQCLAEFFSEKDGREVPDTIALTLAFPKDIVVTWQSTFSNSRYGLGERLLGSDGTIEHVAGSNEMVTGVRRKARITIRKK